MSKKVKHIGVTILLLGSIVILSYLVYKNRIPSKEEETTFKMKVGDVNLYEESLDELMLRMRKLANFPEDLYIKNQITIHFDSEGTMESFEGFFYGKVENERIKNYLVSYDRKKSESLTISVSDSSDLTVTSDQKVEPFFLTMNRIHLKEAVSGWNEKEYGILYKGYRSFGYNTDGIRYIDAQGNTMDAKNAFTELTGYFISVYIPNKEKEIIPIRFSLVEDLSKIPAEDVSNAQTVQAQTENNTVSRYMVSKEAGYQLVITDAALGSRCYALQKTEDGGEEWEICNEDPCVGEAGSSAEIYFLDEKTGFLALRSASGNQGSLYRTEDGGTTFKKSVIQSEQAGEVFDTPELPRTEDGMLKVTVSQGADGDYDGGKSAIFASKDQGKTWEFLSFTS